MKTCLVHVSCAGGRWLHAMGRWLIHANATVAWKWDMCAGEVGHDTQHVNREIIKRANMERRSIDELS